MNVATGINPFRSNVVQDAWQSPADVPSIHAEVFRSCLAGIASAAQGVPDSLLIYGPAGSGKTHLLTRLQRHLAETAAAAPDRVLHCVFVFVRLQTSPSLLWQHVRRRLASDLMRRDQGVTQLQRLIAHQMSLGDTNSPRARVMSFRVLSAADQETLVAHLDTVAQALSLPRDLGIILEHLVCGRHVRDASAWLAGESLPDAVLAQLGVGPDLADDHEALAREIVTALCRLAGETLPIVFCFDQVEALQRGLDDRDAFYVFGRTAADLCDADPNVFVITCLQSSYVDVFKTCIRGADSDRMGRREAVLEELTLTQVEKLVRARLDQTTDPTVATVGGSSCFTPSRELLRALAEDKPCVARRVLAGAARAYDAEMLGQTPTQVAAPDFLRSELEARRLAALRESTPADTKRIVLGGLEALSVLRGLGSYVPEPKTADFVLRTEPPTAVEICDEADGRSLGPRLKRILANTPRPDGARTVILRDPRLTIAKSATKTREHLKTLRGRGVAFVEPSVEALAALAALGALLADAKSGDLTNGGATIPESGVVDWLRHLQTDLLLEPIGEFADALVQAHAEPLDAVADDLADLLSIKRILEVEVASAHLDVKPTRLLEVIRRGANRFLLLEGPPEVVLDIAGVVAASEVAP